MGSHFGVGAPPILEPILVGIGMFTEVYGLLTNGLIDPERPSTQMCGSPVKLHSTWLGIVNAEWMCVHVLFRGRFSITSSAI